MVLCEDRDGLRRHLDEHGISSDIHYPIPDHKQPAYLDSGVEGLAVTELMARQIVTVPCFNGMEEDEISRVVAAMNGW